jgi:hypothetical protein
MDEEARRVNAVNLHDFITNASERNFSHKEYKGHKMNRAAARDRGYAQVSSWKVNPEKLKGSFPLHRGLSF